MVDYVITPGEVVAGTGVDATFEGGTAGEVIAAGDPVYLKASDSKWYKADANVDDATAAARGVAVGSALVAGQRLSVQTGGDMTTGATAAIPNGGVVVLSANPGKLAPVADLAAGWRRTVVGVGKTGGLLRLRPWASGVTG